MSRSQLIIVLVLFAGAAGAIWWMMGDADKKAIEQMLKDCATAAEAGDAKTIVDKLHGNFTFTAGSKTVTFKDLKENGNSVLKNAKLSDISVRSITIERDGDAATAVINLTLKSGATEIQSPYPYKIEVELTRSGVEGDKKWQMMSGVLTVMREK